MHIKRSLAMLGLLVASLAGFVLGPAGAAHAAFPSHTITPQIKLFIHDEEGFFFSDELTNLNLNGGQGTVSSAVSQTWHWTTGCITGEIQVDVTLKVNLDVTGRIQTRTDVTLFEGNSNCASMHFAGSGFRNKAGTGAGFNSLPTFRVNNTTDYSKADIAAGDCDFVDVTTTFNDF